MAKKREKIDFKLFCNTSVMVWERMVWILQNAGYLTNFYCKHNHKKLFLFKIIFCDYGHNRELLNTKNKNFKYHDLKPLHVLNSNARSSPLQGTFKTGALKKFAMFTEKHLCLSLCLLKLQAWRPATLLKRDSRFSWE